MTGADRHELTVFVTDTAPAEWAEFLQDAAGVEFFHTTLWTESVTRQIPDCVQHWITVRCDEGLVGGLVALRQQTGWFQRLVSSHEGTCSGPLVRSDLPAALQEQIVATLLDRYAESLRGRCLQVSFTWAAAAVQRWDRLAQVAGWSGQAVPGAVIPLEGGLEFVERHIFKKNRRNERNRALKRGCVAGVTQDPELLAQYYPIYLASARRWGITPTPLSLLRELLVAAGEHVFLSYVLFADELIGGHVNFHWGQRVTAWNGATLAEHNDKFPATLLIWTDISEACQRGATVLDLGGSGGIATLAKFKKLLGASEEARVHYQKTRRFHRWLRLGRSLLRRQDGS
ncbi:MAG: GNAT family N-acetyltransferase [bacterium]